MAVKRKKKIVKKIKKVEVVSSKKEITKRPEINYSKDFLAIAKKYPLLKNTKFNLGFPESMFAKKLLLERKLDDKTIMKQVVMEYSWTKFGKPRLGFLRRVINNGQIPGLNKGRKLIEIKSK